MKRRRAAGAPARAGGGEARASRYTEATAPRLPEMMRLPESLRAWGSPAFNATLKHELAGLDADRLPLQQGLTRSSHALGDGFEVIVLGASAQADRIEARVGVFYAGIIAGCSCADDPTPVDEQIEYCELLVVIDRHSAAATFTLLED